MWFQTSRIAFNTTFIYCWGCSGVHQLNIQLSCHKSMVPNLPERTGYVCRGGWSTTLDWNWEWACQFYSRSRLFWGIEWTGWGDLFTTWDCHLKVADDVDRKLAGFIHSRNWADQVSRGSWSTTLCWNQELASRAYRKSCLQQAGQICKMAGSCC